MYDKENTGSNTIVARTDAQLETNGNSSGIISMRLDVLVRIALLGLGLGVIAWLLALLLGNYVVGPVFCPTSASVAKCANTTNVAGNITLVLASIAGMLGLVKLGVYRPMLIAIAVIIGLWGIGAWLSGIVWYEALGWEALIYMVTYVAFAWLVRPRNFIIASVSLVAVVILVHWITTL